jgi:lysophospholipid acyltransferase (LPLAT)-like uncharacterized protein
MPRKPADGEYREGGTSTAGENPAPGLWDRVRFAAVSTVGSFLIRMICSTVRWDVEGWENYRCFESAGKRRIMAFWHGRIIGAAWYFRRRGIVVMVSRNKDGEYITRVIRRLGYRTARGSSSRGGGRALVEMLRALRGKSDVGFSVDGPRGPRYVAKSGPVWLAARSGQPILPFHVSARSKWEFSSWDRFQVPKPFTRCLVLIGEPIHVPPGAAEAELEASLRTLQASLDDLRSRGDSHWNEARAR